MKIQIFLLLLFPLQLICQSTILKNVQVVDVENQRIIKNTSVVISEGIIEEIKPFKKLRSEKEDRIIDGAGQYLIPGLMDTHIHFFQSGSIYTRPDALDMRDFTPYEDEISFAKSNAQDYLGRYLRQGITTVMDVGGPMWNYTVRDSIAKSKINPNVLVTGPLFSMVERTELDLGDPPIIKISSKEDVLNLFEKQLPYKPDFIKVWYVVSSENPAAKTYPLVEYLGQLCTENNLKLAVHATELETAKLAIKAGASILVHSVDDEIIPDDFVKNLVKNKVTYIPTLTVIDGYIKTFIGDIQHSKEDLASANPHAYSTLLDPNKIPENEWPGQLQSLYGKSRPKGLNRMDSIMASNLSILSKAKVNIATGTDAGNIGTMHASSYMKEIRAMQKAGLSNWELLTSSTLNAAVGFGIDNKVGSIAKGKQADLVLLKNNPIEDIETLLEPTLVIKSGQVLEPRLILEESPEQVVQRQLNAYNARDIDAFISTYSEDVKIYNESDELMMAGHEEMRERYAPMFETVTNLYCEIESRIVISNKVIDKEKVRLNNGFLNAVAIYKVEEGKIVEVRFLR